MEATPSFTEQLLGLANAHRARHDADVAFTLHLISLAHAYQVSEDRLLAGSEQLKHYGGDGTPEVGEFLLAEIAPLVRCSVESARRQLADALDLFHRHPRLWEVVLDGGVELWQAHQVVRATRNAGLSHEAALWVDHHAALALSWQPFGRVMGQVEKWILQADPALAAARAERRSAERHVTLSRIADGHINVYGQLDAADGLALDAALDQLAGRLASPDDDAGGPHPRQPGTPPRPSRTHQTRRAVALGQLARLALGEPSLFDLTTSTKPTEATEPAAPARRAVLHLHLSPAPTAPSLPGHSAPDGSVGAAPLGPVASIDDWGHVLTAQLRQLLAGIRPNNLGPLSRFSHRVKTFGGWHLTYTGNGSYRWRSPHGFTYHVHPYGTTRLIAPQLPGARDPRRRSPADVSQARRSDPAPF